MTEAEAIERCERAGVRGKMQALYVARETRHPAPTYERLGEEFGCTRLHVGVLLGRARHRIWDFEDAQRAAELEDEPPLPVGVVAYWNTIIEVMEPTRHAPHGPLMGYSAGVSPNRLAEMSAAERRRYAEAVCLRSPVVSGWDWTDWR